jgi:hypothetical protein
MAAPNIEGTSNPQALAGGGVLVQAFTTANAPTYAPGIIYYDLTLSKLRVGGASAYETITSA